MTRGRGFTLGAHGAVEFVLGLATLVSPAVFGFGNGGIVVAVLLGSLLVGMAVTLSADPSQSLGWHHLFDIAFVLASALASLTLALAGEPAPAAFFAGLTAIQSGLNLTTRYVAAR